MTLSQLRTYIIQTFFPNSVGAIDGGELQTALLEVANQIELAASWSPVFSLVVDGSRIVMKVIDWTGGVGVKPAVNLYLGASGLTPTLSGAVDIRGVAGPAGSATSAANLSISDNNPASGVLVYLLNTASSSRNGVYQRFGKQGLALWQIGMPPGDDNAFVVNGWGGGAFPEHVRILDNGNVGLGVSAPLGRLDVAGNLLIRVTPGGLDAGEFLSFLVNTAGVSDARALALGAMTGGPGFIRSTISGAGQKPGICFYIANVEAGRFDENANLGLGTATPAEKLDVVGRVKARGIVSAGSVPTIAVGSGLGTSGTSVSIAADSNDLAGKVTMATTAGVGQNAVLATVTFNVGYAVAPRAVILTPRNSKSSDESDRFYVSTITAGYFVISSAGNSPSQPYSFDFQYVVIA